jgi:hypothetical protein
VRNDQADESSDGKGEDEESGERARDEEVEDEDDCFRLAKFSAKREECEREAGEEGGGWGRGG